MCSSWCAYEWYLLELPHDYAYWKAIFKFGFCLSTIHLAIIFSDGAFNKLIFHHMDSINSIGNAHNMLCTSVMQKQNSEILSNKSVMNVCRTFLLRDGPIWFYGGSYKTWNLFDAYGLTTTRMHMPEQFIRLKLDKLFDCIFNSFLFYKIFELKTIFWSN